jgi:HlyD family secretion protein
MTANAEIVIEERENVLRLPNTALRFRPADPEVAARGQAMAAENASPARTRGERGRAGAAGERQGRGASQLAEALELDETQQAAARRAFETAMASAPRGEGQGDRRAAMRQVREQVIREIEPTLNPRQRELLAQMRQGAGPRREVRREAVVWVLRGNRPNPVRVEIGVADNGHTLLHGGLNEGDQVIVGGGPPAQDQQRGPMRPGGVRIRGA